MTDALTAYLDTLDVPQLKALLTNRPEALVPPEPSSIAGLASRLTSYTALGATVYGLNQTQAQVLEAVAALVDREAPANLGNRCRVADLAHLFGLEPDDRDLESALSSLAELALAWPDGAWIHTVPLSRTFPHPLGLGRPQRLLLANRRLEEIRDLATRCGLASTGSKDALISKIVKVFSDPMRVLDLLAGVPKPTLALLTATATEGPYVQNSGYGYGGRATGAAAWALERGLLGTDGSWGSQLEMPAEVTRALRGSHHRLKLVEVPRLETVAVAVEAVQREAAAAAGAALAKLAGVLAECDTQPLALLKTGGVGVREIRRLAKAIDDREDHIRLWLELADAAGLVAQTTAGLMLTPDYDRWSQLEPADQYASIILCWPGLPALPLLPSEQGMSPPAALTTYTEDPLVTMLRPTLAVEMAGLDTGAGLAGRDTMARLIAWTHPKIRSKFSAGDFGPILASIWREAELLGLVAHNAATSIARALLGLPTGADDRLIEAIGALLPPAQSQVRVQADLTAVAAGTPSRQLVDLLDTVADRESRGGASTWRFSPASIFRAFDAGMSQDDIHSSLIRIAVGGVLPQPLTYLIADAARRHGLVRVRPVACVLRSDDPALLTEITHAKGLKKLSLMVLAPTVLGSALPVTETLAALRAAGYAPAGERVDGTTAIERVPRQRATAALNGYDDEDDPDWEDGLSFLSPESFAQLLTHPDLLDETGLGDELLAALAATRPADLANIGDPDELARNLAKRR